MKRYLLILIVIVHVCSNAFAQFVEIDEETKKFMLNGEEFYPVAMNYSTNFRFDGTKIYVIPAHGYGSTNAIECDNGTDCLETIKADMQMLQDLGFNSIRLLGFKPRYIDAEETQLGYSIMYTDYPTTIDQPFQEDFSDQFQVLHSILDIIEEVGLKVIIATNGAIQDPIWENYLAALLDEFKDNTTIFAYDFFNEPYLYDPEVRTKDEVCGIVSEWRLLVDTYAPNHMLTIGFNHAFEVFEWDPEILPVDFASFHPYPNERSFYNDVYWYGQYITKPWIIGETGIAADNISVSYEEQRSYAKSTLQNTINCGGSGYSWWQYQEVYWGSYWQNYLGLINRIGITQTSEPNLSIEGTPKPAAYEFVDFGSYTPTFDCPCSDNFYNPNGYKNFNISGRLVNGNTGEPVSGGALLGWNQSWGEIRNVFAHPDGTFNFYSDVMLVHLWASAPGMTRNSFDVNWNLPPINMDGGTVEMGETLTQKTSTTITTSNYLVDGNGSTGGILRLYAGQNIRFEDGFKVNKGGRLIAMNKYDIGDVIVYPVNSCNTTFKSITNSGATKAKEIDLQGIDINNISIYPNPSDGEFVISGLNDINNVDIEVLDIMGKPIYNTNVTENETVINISNHPEGVYIIRIVRDQNVITRRIQIR
ncbi:MAG: T9SS type A sorting domain-containing protein [Bacteroidales bacterium]|nr:T9SS type A sorting domain-containing protein [Bacteroidales bacterium]